MSPPRLYISALLGTPPSTSKTIPSHLKDNAWFIADFVQANHLLEKHAWGQEWHTGLDIFSELRKLQSAEASSSAHLLPHGPPTSTCFELPCPPKPFYKVATSSRDLKANFLSSIKWQARRARKADHVLVLFGHGGAEQTGGRVGCGDGAWLSCDDVEKALGRCKACRVSLVSISNAASQWQSTAAQSVAPWLSTDAQWITWADVLGETEPRAIGIDTQAALCCPPNSEWDANRRLVLVPWAPNGSRDDAAHRESVDDADSDSDSDSYSDSESESESDEGEDRVGALLAAQAELDAATVVDHALLEKRVVHWQTTTGPQNQTELLGNSSRQRLNRLATQFRAGTISAADERALFRLFATRAAADADAQQVADDLGLAHPATRCADFGHVEVVPACQGVREIMIDWGRLTPRDDAVVDDLKRPYGKAGKWLFEVWRLSGQGVEVLDEILVRVGGEIDRARWDPSLRRNQPESAQSES